MRVPKISQFPSILYKAWWIVTGEVGVVQGLTDTECAKVGWDECNPRCHREPDEVS